MSQTTKIAAVIILLFIVFITLKGQLKSYIAVFFGSPQTASSSSSSSQQPLGATVTNAFANPPAGSTGAAIMNYFHNFNNTDFLNANAPSISSFFGGG